MKIRRLLSLLSLCALVAGPASAQVISFNFASFGNSFIHFDGASHLTFAPDSGTGHDFQIASNASGLAAGLAGLYGDISDPTLNNNPSQYTLSNISSPFPGVETANVTGGKGDFSIFDGSGGVLTAKVWWVNAVQVGGVAGLNPSGSLNLNNFSYNGTNSSLQALAAQASGTSTISFQFTQPTTLTQLATVAQDTNFSGSFSAGSAANVPEPSAYAAVLGVLALAGAHFRRRFAGV